MNENKPTIIILRIKGKMVHWASTEWYSMRARQEDPEKAAKLMTKVTKVAAESKDVEEAIRRMKEEGFNVVRADKEEEPA